MDAYERSGPDAFADAAPGQKQEINSHHSTPPPATTRLERIECLVSSAPRSVQKSLRRAFSGAASPRQAIKAQCLVCVGYDRSAIKNCAGYSCPLWSYRPFQHGEAA